MGFFQKNYNSIDYLTNSIKTTFPPGSEFSIYKAECLRYANENTEHHDPLREHVGINITNKDFFRIKNMEAEGIFNEPNIYLEVDTIEDFKMLSQLVPIVIDERGIDFGLKDLIEVSKMKPEISNQNKYVKRRWREFRKE